MKEDYEYQEDDQPKHSEIETIRNYSKALGQYIHLKMFEGNENGVSHVSELFMHYKLKMTKYKLK